jgi:hypothetical protein
MGNVWSKYVENKMSTRREIADDLEQMIQKLPGRKQALKGDYGEGVVYDNWTGHLALVRQGPKGSNIGERGVFVRGDMNTGNMPYATNSRYFRVSEEVLAQMMAEARSRGLTEEQIEEYLNGIFG